MSLYPGPGGNYRTRKFTDIFPDYATFQTETAACSIPISLSEVNLQTLYYLLYARYGNSHIASSDENQFKYKMWSVIFQYGPTWEKKLEVQENLRGLTDDELMTSYKNINNVSMNPSTEPSTGSLEELTTINQQTTSMAKRGKLGAYAQLWEILVSDVTEQFLSKFKKLFLVVVDPEDPLWYVTEEEE